MPLDTILIVDDEAQQRDALSDFFTSVADYSVLTVASGDEAIGILASRKQTGEKTKAIIMDVKMPGKNGLETSLEIKSSVDRNIPVIFNTAFPDEFSESLLRDRFPFFAYQTKGDDLDGLAIKVERAVCHYNLMNEEVESSPDDATSFTVKNCPVTSDDRSSPDVIREFLAAYRGRPDVYLASIANDAACVEKVMLIEGLLDLPQQFERAEQRNPSRVVCFGSLTKHCQEIFETLVSGGQALFVTGLPSMSVSEKVLLKRRLNEQGFIVERMVETADRKLVIDARKPIVIEDARSGLVLREAQSDREMRDYYSITRAYFDLLTREIDMSFDQVSAHFVVYWKDGMVPVSTIRVVPKAKIRLPVEFGTLPDGSFYDFKDKSCAEISHTANLTADKAKERNVSFRTFGASLKMLFSSCLRYCVANKIGALVLTYDESDVKLENLYVNLGFAKAGTSLGYPGYPKKYAVMSLDIAESFRNAIRNNNRTQVAVITGVLNDPVKTFLLVHDAMFAAVPAYQAMYSEVVAEIQKRKDGPARRLVVDMPVITGNLSRMLAPKYDIIGVDLSRDGLDLAEKKARYANPDVRYSTVEANVIEGVPIESGSADVVACVNLLYALREPEKALAEIHRILKPGGYVVITTFNGNVLLSKGDFMAKIHERFSSKEASHVEFWKDSNDLANLSSDVIESSYFSQETLAAKMTEAGFEVEDVRETFLGNSSVAVGRK
jgi:ubiquinone/menaquinone biosynthesis C-methylase UbiE/CheY-like chemotaxis protein